MRCTRHRWKTALCWLSALVLGALQFVVPYLIPGCKDLDDDELEECMGPGWSIYFAFIEGVCRVCVGILLVEFIWKVPKMKFHCPRTCGHFTGLGFSWIFAGLTLYVACASEWDHPSWVEAYAIFADFFCHVVVTTALVGFLYDAAFACFRGQCWEMLAHYCFCQGDLEASGLKSGAKLEVKHEFFPGRRFQCRILAKWLAAVLVAVLWMRSIWLGDDMLWEWRLLLLLLNAVCWTGIAWELAAAVRDRRLRFLDTVPNFEIPEPTYKEDDDGSADLGSSDFSESDSSSAR